MLIIDFLTIDNLLIGIIYTKCSTLYMLHCCKNKVYATVLQYIF